MFTKDPSQHVKNTPAINDTYSIKNQNKQQTHYLPYLTKIGEHDVRSSALPRYLEILKTQDIRTKMSAVKGKTLLLLPAALAATYLVAGASGALEIDSQVRINFLKLFSISTF